MTSSPSPTVTSGAPVAASRPARRRVLVLCPGAWDREALAGPSATGYDVVHHAEELARTPTLLEALRYDAFRFADETARRFRGQGIEGVVGTGDYPGCILAALVAERLGLPSPRARDVVVLSHKHYSRERQRRVVPEATPAFEAIPLPRAFGRVRTPRLGYPLFVKPVKGTMSIRARLVQSDDELADAMRFPLRERVEKALLLRPFGQLLRAYTDGTVPESWFIGERPLAGVQVTVDGFSEGGRATVMGIVDSVMYPGTMSFQRFEYPSRLPAAVQERMADVARRLMDGIGFDASCWNVEMFWNEATGEVHVIEINPRMSYQFGDLYDRVDGTHTYRVQLALATGQPAPWSPGAGASSVAASFVLRRFEDATVRRVPTERELDEVARRFPRTTVKVLCAPGERLSHHDQDAFSFRYGIVNMDAPSREALYANWAEVERTLRFEFA